MTSRAALALALAASLAACDGGSERELRLPGAESVPARPADVIARVNGRPITGAMVDLYGDARRQQHPLGQPPGRDDLVQELINMELLAQAGERAGLLQDATLASALYVERANLLAAAMMERMGAEPPSDAQVDARYRERYPDGRITEYRTRQILVSQEATARELIGQLEDGADFAALARERSRGPAASQGGALDWFRPGDVLPEFAAAVTSLEPGAFTRTPARTTYGWHVVLLEEVRRTTAPTPEEAAEQIRAELVTEALEQRLEELRAEAEIEFER